MLRYRRWRRLGGLLDLSMVMAGSRSMGGSGRLSGGTWSRHTRPGTGHRGGWQRGKGSGVESRRGSYSRRHSRTDYLRRAGSRMHGAFDTPSVVFLETVGTLGGYGNTSYYLLLAYLGVVILGAEAASHPVVALPNPVAPSLAPATESWFPHKPLDPAGPQSWQVERRRRYSLPHGNYLVPGVF